MPDVFLSPHHDDVCFSLSATVIAREGGDLLNLFTESEYLADRLSITGNRESRVKQITEIRTREDIEFAGSCNLRRHDLKLQEPTILGVHPFDLSNIQSDIDRLEGPLLSILYCMCKKNAPRKQSLFCPMGIGGHRNHLATLIVVATALINLRTIYNVYFYEDLHYASNYHIREEGLSRAFDILGQVQLLRQVIPLSHSQFAKKMELVKIYSSQHSGPPNASKFIPAAPDCLGPHEVIWSISQPTRP